MTSPNQDTQVLPFDDAGIAEGAALIRAGECVAVATETVYGLATDATSGAAVARVYEAKGRPDFNPLIVHVGSLEEVEALAIFDDAARSLAARFWPGPLTLVLPARPGSPVAEAATAGLPTVAIRAPAHPAIRALIAASGRPLAAPSANASGRISPTTAEHVLRTLNGRIPLVIDAGPTSAGLESTIVALTGGEPRLLRPGPIAAGALGLARSSERRSIEAPGQMDSHYKPSKPIALNVTESADGVWLIGFGPVPGDASLSASGDLNEAASTLYAALHQADASPRTSIAVAPIPDYGVGAAINDRLHRAAAPD